MKILQICLLLLLGACITAQEDWIPNAIYEIRYWQSVSSIGNNEVAIDTMVYVGDRAGFSYQNAECISFNCKDTDSILYALSPKFVTDQEEYTLGNHFVRKMKSDTLSFRNRNRVVHKVFATDVLNKNSGVGDYSFITNEFGVIYRWNFDNEVYQLNRIDVVRNGKVLDEIDLLPLWERIYLSKLFGSR